MKQSIEKAFEESWLNDYYHGNYKGHAQVGFYAGAEWQSKQSPWISVKEKEPITNEPILVILEGKPVIMVLCGWDNRLDHHPNITHWMPIPEV